MRLNKYLKFFLMMAASLGGSALTEAKTSEKVVSQITLLPECNGLDHIKGIDPLNAKTVIFGEVHADKKCESSIAKCARALSKGIIKKNILGLIEDVPHDMQTTCLSFSPTLEFPSIVGECKGWNHPSSQEFTDLIVSQMALRDVLGEYMRIIDLHKELSLEYSQPSDTLKLTSFLEKSVQVLSEEIARLRKTETREFDNFKLENKAAISSKFYFSETARMKVREASLQLSRKVLKQINLGIPLLEIIFTLKNQLIETTQKIDNAGENLETFLAIPNQSLVNTLKAETSKKQKIYSVVGLGHVKRVPDTFGKEQKEIIDELYRELDKYSDKNPYAVLACR